MNVKQAIDYAASLIQSDSPKIDAEYLLSYCLCQSLTWLKTWSDYELKSSEESKFLQLVERRVNGEPVAYITGHKGFWTLDLETNSSTLIPRAETELLVEISLEKLAGRSSPKILDLGTGTGAIALALASELPNAEVIGSDFNRDAVELAERNAEKNQISNANFFVSDWFNSIIRPSNGFDWIVSNPPYIAEGDLHLEQGDLVFEPDSALISAEEGFADIIKIASQASQFLKKGGGLAIEHGYKQAQQVRAILKLNGYSDIGSFQDIGGNDRITIGIW